MRPLPTGKSASTPPDPPDKEQCLAILKEAGCDDGVIEHCKAVGKLSILIAFHCGEKIELDTDLILAGALLHDVGRSVTHDVQHVIEGVRILEGLGVDGRVIDIVRKHLGAGLTGEDARALGFPDDDYIPGTMEEKIVAHADNLVGDTSSPDCRRTVQEAIQRLINRGLPDAARRMKDLHEELSKLCGKDIDEI